MIIYEDYNIKELTSFKLNCKAKYVFEANNAYEIFILKYLFDYFEINYNVIGKGSKVIFDKSYITTPIIFKLLSETKIKQFTFMVQKEVGDRLTGKPNTKDYNSLSVAMEYKTDSRVAYKVSPNSFYPAPKVDSALMVVNVKQMDFNPDFDAQFLKFVQEIFSQRRKTVINNLNGKYSYDKQRLIDLFDSNNININLRAETMTINDILKLYNLIVGNQ